MRWKSKAWGVLGTVAAVEELKDKSLCNWINSTLRSLLYHQHHVISNRDYRVKPLSTTQEGKSSSSSSSTSKMVSKKRISKQETLKQPADEESLRLIMYLSCWGPNS